MKNSTSMGKRNEYFPETVTHPGLTLEEKLAELAMSQKEFAMRTGKPEKTIVKVIAGESAITPDMAVVFEKVLKIPASFWLKRQYAFDEALARNKRKQDIAASLEWAKRFPYADMAKKGWVTATRKLEEKAENLLDFFGISSSNAWDNIYIEGKLKVAFRLSLKHTKEPEAISAWLRQGELQAAQVQVTDYDPKQFKKKLDKVKSLMAEHPDDFFTQLQALCHKAGVKVVYTPCLPHAPMNGCTRWLGDTPLIQLSGRHKRNDIFWFTFFHEAGHILKHGKKEIFLEEEGNNRHDTEKEAEADRFAVEHTFTEAEEQQVIEALPLLPDDIKKFAKKFNTHPAIIVGRLARKGYYHDSFGFKNEFYKEVNFSD